MSIRESLEGLKTAVEARMNLKKMSDEDIMDMIDKLQGPKRSKANKDQDKADIKALKAELKKRGFKTEAGKIEEATDDIKKVNTPELDTSSDKPFIIIGVGGKTAKLNMVNARLYAETILKKVKEGKK